MVSAEEPSRSRLDDCLLIGCYQSPPPPSSPDSYELTISWHAPHTSRIRPSASVALTSVDSASHATHPVLAETKGSIRGLASRTPPRNGDSGLCISLGPMEGPFLAKRGVILDTAHRRKVVMTDTSNKGWGALCKGKPTFGLWSEEESGLHISWLEMLAVCQACHFFLPDIPGHHVLIRSDSRSVVSYINHQGSLVSKRLCVLANDLLVWAQNYLRSLKATHLPGKMNRGADMLSRNNVSSEEWMLHPLVVQRICETFGRAWVDLFLSKDNSHCLICFTMSMDALAHEWPSLPLYAFPPVALLPQVLRRVREQWHKLILIAPLWRN